MSDDELLDFYHRHLLVDTMPFWMKHAVDRENGGLFTCLRDDGSVINRDKYLWSQGRALWVFSRLYNRIEPREEWLDAAKGLRDFIVRHGRDAEGRWVFLLDEKGAVKEGEKSIYVDGFVLSGLTEYARATGDEEAAEIARGVFESVRDRLARPGSYATAPYAIPEGGKVHGVRMIFSLGFHELATLLDDAEIEAAAVELAEDILENFRQPRIEWLLEYVGLDNRPRLDQPWGRCVVPGHAIESMWFLMHIFRHLGVRRRIDQAVECIRWHIEKGWDREYGGVLLGMDAEGKEPIYWENWDKKSWWQQTEALYALLLCREYTDADWPEEWYWRVHDYAFSRYPVPEHGEWTQRLDRKGEIITELICLPVKDPFHLPRALIWIIDCLERRTGRRVTRPRIEV